MSSRQLCGINERIIAKSLIERTEQFTRPYSRLIVQLNPELVRKMALFMNHEQINFVYKPSPNCLDGPLGFCPYILGR